MSEISTFFMLVVIPDRKKIAAENFASAWRSIISKSLGGCFIIERRGGFLSTFSNGKVSWTHCFRKTRFILTKWKFVFIKQIVYWRYFVSLHEHILFKQTFFIKFSAPFSIFLIFMTFAVRIRKKCNAVTLFDSLRHEFLIQNSIEKTYSTIKIVYK